MSILRYGTALIMGALTLTTSMTTMATEVSDLEGRWRGRICTAEGIPTKTNLSIDKYGCYVIYQTDLNGAAQATGTVDVEGKKVTFYDNHKVPYMILQLSDEGQLVQDVRGKIPENCCFLKKR